MGNATIPYETLKYAAEGGNDFSVNLIVMIIVIIIIWILLARKGETD